MTPELKITSLFVLFWVMLYASKNAKMVKKLLMVLKEDRWASLPDGEKLGERNFSADRTRPAYGMSNDTSATLLESE